MFWHTDAHTLCALRPNSPMCAHIHLHTCIPTPRYMHMYTTCVCMRPNKHEFICAQSMRMLTQYSDADIHRHQHICAHTLIQMCTQALTHVHREASAFREAPRAPQDKGRPQTIDPFVAGLSRNPEEWEEGGRRVGPLTPAQPGLRPQGHGGQLEFCVAALPGEQPPRTYCKSCQNALHKLPFRVFFFFRFTQFVNNKIKSHFNGKGRIIEHFSKSSPATKTFFPAASA